MVDMAEAKPTPPPIEVPDNTSIAATEDGPVAETPSDDSNPELRAEAPAFVPQEIKAPPRVRTSKSKGDKKDLYRVLDSVPFTPSQGVKTPSPNNMAALRFHKYSPFANGSYPDSPTTVLRSFGGASDSSTTSETGPVPMPSPVHAGHPMPPHPYQNSYIMFPGGMMGYPPEAIPGSPHGSPLIGSPCGTPTAMMFPQTPFGVAPHSPFGPYPGPAAFSPQQQQMYPGPDPMSPSHRSYSYFHPMFSTGFPTFIPGMASPSGSSGSGPHHSGKGGFEHGNDHFHSDRSNSPNQMPHRRAPIPHMAPMGPGPLYGPMPMAPAPSQLSRNSNSPLPQQQFVYDDFSDDSSGNLPNTRSRFRPRRSIQDFKVGPDGQPRLNARQRRTLRRAKERALKGLMDTGHLMVQRHGLGGTSESGDKDSDAGNQAAEVAGSSGSSQYGSDKEVSSLFYDQNSSEKPSSESGDLDGVDVAELIKQLSLKKEEGVVDDKLIRDLQIIQSLIGALKVPVPAPQPPPKRSPPRKHNDFHNPPKPRRTYNVHAFG